ncbi:phosphatase PAP2 family protein [Streptomyces sp. PTM05]|uniref:Phosphatase PAP2 family protein n=1 Tax=Streptantibioticus parmotrematis TaxID=2873249 RepID=A0ABS7QUA1_9ACTN|nr:phosphatase PAP2 family protein [Streptantibioticus parmotrematis]
MPERLGRLDRQAFREVARRRWPGAEQVLPRLSRSANHGVLWLGTAVGVAALSGRTGRRAALRGAGSLAVASTVVNTMAKWSVRRARPALTDVPAVRRLRRQPATTSFPSGHAASAAAFAFGVALEEPRWGVLIAPVAASVAFSRVYTGVHYPSDVLAGAAVGVAAALVVRRAFPVPRRVAPPAADAPALADGDGLTVVVNHASGVPAVLTSPADCLRSALPKAEVVDATEDDDFGTLVEKAARQAAERGGALGVWGGDGSVNRAAAAAARCGVPLAVFPGGTYNHLAADLGVQSLAQTVAAVCAGQAAHIDVARFTGSDGTAVPYLNTFSIGAYPELVRLRERWARRVGSWPAGLLAAAHVLRTSRPVPLVIDGRQREVWLLFAGNCAYPGAGLAPSHRRDLADGRLDVRVVEGGTFARTRLLAAALTGALHRSPFYRARTATSLRVSGIPRGTHLAYDGEVTTAPEHTTLTKAPEPLVVYRPPGPPAERRARTTGGAR